MLVGGVTISWFGVALTPQHESGAGIPTLGTVSDDEIYQPEEGKLSRLW